MDFFQSKYFYCINTKKLLRTNYLYSYKDNKKKSYKIHNIMIKNYQFKVPVLNINSRCIGFSKICFCNYQLYNKFDKTFFEIQNVYTNQKYIYEIKDNYFLFPFEMEIMLTIIDNKEVPINYPITLSLYPIQTKSLSNWYSIANQSDYCHLKLKLEDIECEWNGRKRTILTFIGTSEIYYHFEKTAMLFYGNQQKSLFYYTIVI
jgi:hypothetical protein